MRDAEEGAGARRAAETAGPPRLRVRPADVIDVFVYVVVLNLAIEYFPSVISESFTLSLLTALLLKVSLEVVLLVKGWVVAHLRAADSRRAKVAIGLLLGWSRPAASWSCSSWWTWSSVTG